MKLVKKFRHYLNVIDIFCKLPLAIQIEQGSVNIIHPAVDYMMPQLRLAYNTMTI